MGKYTKKSFESMNKRDLVNRYKCAKRRKDYFTMGIIASYLPKKTDEQSFLYGHYLMFLDDLDQAEEAFKNSSYDDNNYFRLSGIFQIAFEKRNWALASKHLSQLNEFHPQIRPFLSAYRIYITKQLQKDIPHLIMSPLNSPSKQYLEQQISDFDLERTSEFMHRKVIEKPDYFGFGYDDVDNLIQCVSDNLGVLERGNQLNVFNQPPMFFDKYQFTTDNGVVEASTIPFTKNLYTIKPLVKPDNTKPVYTLRR